MGQKLRVLFVASEGVPFAKTGGLADVVGTLPAALVEQGVEVKVLMPYYRAVKEGKVPTTLIAEDLEVNLGLINHPFNLMAPVAQGFPFYFVERDEFYDRSQLYGTPKGDYFDNLERFAFFAGAVLPFCRALDFTPDVIHCHDWQSALVPVYLQQCWCGEDVLSKSKTVFTIHNLAYQGLFPQEKYPLLGLDWSFYRIDGLEYYGKINLLKGGILCADAVTTVSPRYSVEIQTPEFGYGLEGVLQTRAAKLHGIINGVDYEDWSPETDSLIPAKFSPDDLKGKAANKAALMEVFGLSKDLADAPILAIISRLADQKGFDLLAEILPKLMKQKLMLVILGTGDEKYHRWLETEAPKYKGKLGAKIAFDNYLAHLIEAGADMFLMPSRYEPCGLNQIYSMKYGTIPVVRATGGLADTVTPVGDPKTPGTGFVFSDYTPEAFLKAIHTALDAYANKDLWNRIMLHAMAQDFSWKVSARKYLELYKSLVK
jgi:starch synthase